MTGKPMMNAIVPIVLMALCGWLLPANAQLKYENADSFPLHGKISDDTETRYERLPASLNGMIREPVWALGKNTAGLYLRFRSNSTSIGLKWTLYQNRMMSHMTETGIKGFDLYSLKDGEWVFVNSARPQVNSMDNEARIIANMDTTTKEFLLHFPLYDGVVDLQIGIDSTANLEQPSVALPTMGSPVICYGTSILQGACASRPGMAHTNILLRRFNREFVNLGFSGNARLDYEVAEIIAEKPSSLIVLDFMPNVSVELIEERMERFYRIIREKHPETMILFIENPHYPHGAFDQQVKRTIDEKNQALHREFNKLVSRGERHIYLVPAMGMIGTDGEATIDGVHFTDLGYMRYADYLYPYIDMFLDE